MFGVVHAGVGYECTPTPVQTRLLYGNSFEAEIVWSTHTAGHSTSFAIQLAANSQPQRYAFCLTRMTDRHTCKHTGTESTPTLSLLLRLACVSTPLSHLPCQVSCEGVHVAASVVCTCKQVDCSAYCRSPSLQSASDCTLPALARGLMQTGMSWLQAQPVASRIWHITGCSNAALAEQPGLLDDWSRNWGAIL